VSAAGAVVSGLRRTFRSWGLGVVLLAANLGVAALLAVPLAVTLAADFRERPSAAAMRDGFDYPWWSRWSDTRTGIAGSLSPDVLGAGLGLKNLDLLLKGQIPAGLFAVRDAEDRRRVLLDPVILAAGAGFMAVHVFLSGGIFSVLRQAQGRWTMRAVLHGAGFHFGRFARIALLMLAAVAVVFALNAPFARWADTQARESVSETAAHAWLLGRHAVLLAALVFVHLAGTYARAITVVEERTSAGLAVLSGFAFAAGHPLATAGIAAAISALFLAAYAAWQAFDAAWTARGYATQAALLLAMQAFVLVRILLRVALSAALMDFYRARMRAQ
jgi:hypothetical protein